MEAITAYRYSAYLLLLCIGSFCQAQEAKVRVINAANRRPPPKQAVSVSFLYDKKYDKEIAAKYVAALNLETDANGEAYFKLPEPPPVHFSAEVRMDWSHWKCGCGILGSTDDLVRKGIVGPVATTDSKKSAALFKAVPGEILFAARPLSFIERLLYPIMKQ
jgi:hypothetical protein